MSVGREQSRPAVFMDRDGCLTEEVGYVNHPGRIRLLPRTAAAVRRLNQAGVAAVMVTNQAGVARGYFPEAVLHAANARMCGDKLSDVAAAHAAGTAGVLVLTGYGRGEWEYQRDAQVVNPDHVAEDLL